MGPYMVFCSSSGHCGSPFASCTRSERLGTRAMNSRNPEHQDAWANSGAPMRMALHRALIILATRGRSLPVIWCQAEAHVTIQIIKVLFSALFLGAQMVSSSIPVVRVASLLRFVRCVESLGAPCEHLLPASGIPVELLEHASAAVSLENAFKFGEKACKAADTEHLGLYVGMWTSLDDLGPMGQKLKRSTTVHDYLRQGVALYNSQITGACLWLSDLGDEIRLNVATMGEGSLATYQSQLETLAITVIALRQALGADWSPDKLGLTYQSKEGFPEHSCFEGSRILRGTRTSYIAIPRHALAAPFPYSSWQSEPEADALDVPSLSGNLCGLVQLQIEELLGDERLHIDTVAESLMMSRRSLQRCLADYGISYSELLADVRMHSAIKHLRCADESITDIAFALGYANASNFTRAFRVRNGVSPQQFRQRLTSDRSFSQRH
jgi:AraC-like DNA-binding protein